MRIAGRDPIRVIITGIPSGIVKGPNGEGVGRAFFFKTQGTPPCRLHACGGKGLGWYGLDGAGTVAGEGRRQSP